jgi:hypothetical protein
MLSSLKVALCSYSINFFQIFLSSSFLIIFCAQGFLIQLFLIISIAYVISFAFAVDVCGSK